MAVYNEEKHINESIESILNQDYNDFELLIVDDFSNDNTYSFAKKYELQDPRIKVFKNNKKGKNSAFNLAYLNSIGDFLCYFAGDDIMPINSISERVKSFSDTQLDMLNDLIFTSGKLLTFSEDYKFDGIVTPRDNRGILSGTTIMFSRSLAKYIFPLPIQIPNEDTWTKLCFECFGKHEFFTTEIVAKYRIHENNSRIRTNDFKLVNENLHSRFIVFELFNQKFHNHLSEKCIREITGKIELENCRYNGRIIKLMLLKNVTISEKIRALFHSVPMLYFFRYKFYKFFSGWSK
jgi:glycosyltransferase involved in cell wall biosynthesis